MNKNTLFAILLGVLILPTIVFAQNTPTIQGIISAAVQTTLYIASGVVVILWVITGILFLSAGGSPDKLVSGRKALLAAIGGTVLVILAQSGLYVVGSMFGITNLINNTSNT